MNIENLKLLSKRLSNYQELVFAQEENFNLKEELSVLKDLYTKETDKLKKENEQLKKYISVNQTYNNNPNTKSNSDLANLLNEKELKKEDLLEKNDKNKRSVNTSIK